MRFSPGSGGEDGGVDVIEIVLDAMTPPRFSIVIPCYNHGDYVGEAVESVRRLGRSDLECVVVDDGSTESATRERIDALEREGVRVVRQANLGLARARNAGIAATTGSIVIPLDADNRLRGALLDRAGQLLSADPAVGVVYGDAEFFGERTGRWEVGPFERFRLIEWNYIDACAAYRREMWERNGGYDPNMPVMGLEDWDFWLGTCRQGWAFEYVPEITFEYRVRSDSMIRSTYGHESAVASYVARKHAALYREVLCHWNREGGTLRRVVRLLRRLAWARWERGKLTD